MAYFIPDWPTTGHCLALFVTAFTATGAGDGVGVIDTALVVEVDEEDEDDVELMLDVGRGAFV